MKLEKFKNIDKKKRFIIIFTVCCVFLLAGVFLYTSFATFTEEKQFNVINGQVQDPGDLYFAVYIDGQITNTFPKKDDGYSFDASQSSCTNGATVSWDNESWSALINFSNYQAENMSRTKCTVHFKESSFADTILSCSDTAANCIQDNASLSSEIATDDPDGNARYIGANPNNYVLFNNELWRIIGVMNDITLDDGAGTKSNLLKIIRDQSIGEYTWDNKPNGVGSSTTAYGSNYWVDSRTNLLLNPGYENQSIGGSLYYNAKNGTCYSGDNNGSVACDFTNNGLKDSASKNMIQTVVWNIGAYSEIYNNVSDWYINERGSAVYDSNYLSTWTGKIGLMYPSDYGYATSGGNATDRNECLTTISSWHQYQDCYNNDWLYTGTNQWTITPGMGYTTFVAAISSYAYISNQPITNGSYSIKPTLYLSSSVKITGGTGTSSDPYELSL